MTAINSCVYRPGPASFSHTPHAATLEPSPLELQAIEQNPNRTNRANYVELRRFK